MAQVKDPLFSVYATGKLGNEFFYSAVSDGRGNYKYVVSKCHGRRSRRFRRERFCEGGSCSTFYKYCKWTGMKMKRTVTMRRLSGMRI